MSKLTVSFSNDLQIVQCLLVNEFLKKKSSAVQINFSKNEKVSVPKIEISGVTLEGDSTCARYLARIAPEAGLIGNPPTDAFKISEVDQWVDFSVEAASDLEGALKTMNEHLKLRSVLVDYQITLADIAVWTAFRRHKDWLKVSIKMTKEFTNVARWMSYLESLPPFVQVSNKAFPKAQTTASKLKTGSKGSFSNLELPNVEMGKVVTRFPPEPSGYLHIGHVKAALLNSYYATTYQGKLLIRFDDTNPTKEKVEFVDSILQDLKTLGIVGHSVSYTSDHFETILKYAEQMLKTGKAYIDDSTQEQISEQRAQGIESPSRNLSVEENMKRWQEMVKGTKLGATYVMRGKIDMQAKNKALRDPNLFRCVLDIPHHRTGLKYKVYPLYDFACPIVDSVEGVTHALRSSEYHDRNPLYYWVADSLGLRRPYIQDFSRLNFSYTVLSKRKLQKFVDLKIVSGWDDPRFPTVQGILRRGLTVEALREFILSQGASKSLNLMDIEKLWALNKKVIDPIAHRHTAVSDEGKVLFVLSDGPSEAENKSIPLHKKNPQLGNKIVTYKNKIFVEQDDAIRMKEGEEVTLMDWGNAVVDKIHKENNKVVKLEGHLHLEGSVKTTEKKLNWLPDIPDLLSVTLVEYDHLITKKKLEPDDVFEEFINKNSEFKTAALADPNVRLVKKGQIIQFERRGYFICDEPFVRPEKPLRFVSVPDGHTTKQQSALSKKVQH